MLLSAFLGGCAHPPHPPAERGARLDRVLQGFLFAGDFPAGQWQLVDSAPHHTLRFPARWEARRHYVFHTDLRLTVEDLAVRVLPERLRDAGMVVLTAPSSLDDMAIPNVGNPVWSIDFRQAHFQGQFHNRFDRVLYYKPPHQPELPDDARRDDLVLTFTN